MPPPTARPEPRWRFGAGVFTLPVEALAVVVAASYLWRYSTVGIVVACLLCLLVGALGGYFARFHRDLDETHASLKAESAALSAELAGFPRRSVGLLTWSIPCSCGAVLKHRGLVELPFGATLAGWHVVDVACPCGRSYAVHVDCRTFPQ